MSWRKFAGPAILASNAMLLILAIIIFSSVKYDEGDTVDADFLWFSGCIGLLSTLMCLGSIVWFSFALGMRSEKTFLSPGDLGNPHNSSVPTSTDSRSSDLPPTNGERPLSHAREKITMEKSEGDRAQIVGFLIIFTSIAMFALMALLGFISILMSLGPGLGFSGGACSNTCESIWSGAILSMWISILLFPCGLIALARPWSWFRTTENNRHNSAVKVIAVIASLLALIVVISYGGPALIVLLIAGMAMLVYYGLEDLELKALKLDEISELIQGIFLALFSIIAITSIINGYGIFSFIYTIGLILILFLPPILCITSGALIMVLRKLNHVEIDGDWGTMDLIVSVYSKIYSEED